MGGSWPHGQTITIKFADILPYCHEISAEISNFYNINLNIIYVQSLLREQNNSIWLELNIPANKVATIQTNIQANK